MTFENIVANKRNAHNELFLLLSQCFQFFEVITLSFLDFCPDVFSHLLQICCNVWKGWTCTLLYNYLDCCKVIQLLECWHKCMKIVMSHRTQWGRVLSIPKSLYDSTIRNVVGTKQTIETILFGTHNLEFSWVI